MSDHSLREALEKLCASTDDEFAGNPMIRVSGSITTDEIRALLAAHTAEPDPVVTDEAVDAAQDVLDEHGHNGLDCRPRSGFGLSVRAALEAAAPLLGPRPLLDREAVEGAIRKPVFTELGTYRGVVDASVDAVMELARPMPTREQIASYLRETVQTLDKDEEWHLADGVLALVSNPPA